MEIENNKSTSLLEVKVNPALQTKTNNKSVEIIYKANFAKTIWSDICPSTWDYQYDRQYFHVLEHGYETNNPVVMPTFLRLTTTAACCRAFCCGMDSCILWCFSKGYCTCIPRSNCCNGVDIISKSYFDRGVFDRQAIGFDGCCGNDPILQGSPQLYEGSSQYVCCCLDCPEAGNECFECYSATCCGDRVFVQPYQSVFGLELSACWLCNCCSLCGLKDGQPLCLQDVAKCLAVGEAVPLRNHLEGAYGAWLSRVKKQVN